MEQLLKKAYCISLFVQIYGRNMATAIQEELSTDHRWAFQGTDIPKHYADLKDVFSKSKAKHCPGLYHRAMWGHNTYFGTEFTQEAQRYLRGTHTRFHFPFCSLWQLILAKVLCRMPWRNPPHFPYLGPALGSLTNPGHSNLRAQRALHASH